MYSLTWFHELILRSRSFGLKYLTVYSEFICLNYTLDVDGVRIRLALVDTPEREEPGYAEATAFTRHNCPVGSTAMYDADDGQTGGSYGRVIGKVWCFGHPVETPDTSLNAMLIHAGHAEILSRFCSASEFSSDDWTNCQ